MVRQAVSKGREAGYALAPAQYDEAMLYSPYDGSLAIAGGAAEDLASWVYGSVEEAQEDWYVAIAASDGLEEMYQRSVGWACDKKRDRRMSLD